MMTFKHWLLFSVVLALFAPALGSDLTLLQSNTTWSLNTPAGVALAPTQTTDRWGSASAVVNEFYYVLGGFAPFRNVISTVERYDPSTNAWSYKTPAPFGAFLPAAAVFNGSIFFMCGQDNNFVPLTSAAVYHASADAWTLIANVPADSVNCAAVATISGVYLIMSAGVRKYDSSLNSWSTVLSPTSSTFQGGFVLNSLLHLVNNTGAVFQWNEITPTWSLLIIPSSTITGLWGTTRCTLAMSSSLLSFDMSTGVAVALDLTDGTAHTLTSWASSYFWQDNSGCAVLSASTLYYLGHVSNQPNVMVRGTMSFLAAVSGSAVGDPHFTAFDGEEFDFMGEHGHIYNLYSSDSLNINARFKKALHPERYPNYENPGFMDFIGVRYGGHRFTLAIRPSTPSINGVSVPFPQVRSVGVELDAPELVVRLSANQILELHAGNPGSEPFFSVLISQHNDEWMEQYLNIAMNISSSESSSGLLGQTRRVDTMSTATGIGADDMGLSNGKNRWNTLVNSQPNQFHVDGDDIFGLLIRTTGNSSVV